MNVAQMHIAVNLGVQKIASHQVDNLLPQEIDFELNKAQDKFVKGRYNQFGNKYGRGFEGSQKRIDDLRTLIVETSVNTTYKGQVGDNIFIDRVLLPVDDDYMFLINQRSLVIHNNCNPICVDNPSGTRYWFEFPLGETINSAGHPASYNGYMGGTNAGYYPYSIIVYLLDENGFGAFHELIADANIGATACADPAVYYDPNTWNLVTPSSLTPQGAPLTMPNQNGVPGVSLLLPENYQPGVPNNAPIVEIKYYDCANAQNSTVNPDIWTLPTVPFTTDYVGEYVETQRTTCEGQNVYTTSAVNRYSQLDDIYTLLKDPFNKTKFDSPVTTINGNAIDVYTDETFYVPKVKFTYIKKPQTIISDTGSVQNTDLPDHTHQEIVDMAVASILELTGDPRYQTFRAEEIRSE